jgi:RNA polymerase sigma-70 factor (ECF subfamily)
MARKGNLAAFEVLVSRYRNRAYLVAVGYLRNRDDALDAVQEAFLRCFRALPKFDLERRFYPWLHRILKNLCLSHLRKRYRARQYSLDQGEEDEPRWELPDFRMNPELEVGRGELRSHLKAAFAELRAKDREILVLKHFQDLSYKEIADILGIPIGTVMSRLFHARRRLKERMDAYLHPRP